MPPATRSNGRIPVAESSSHDPIPDSSLLHPENQQDRTHRIRNLFESFDSSRNGYLVHSDIERAFRDRGIPSEYKYAKDLLDVCDSNSDGRVDLAEFHRYMDNKELELYTIFKQIDMEHNGSISPTELRYALEKAGIKISDKELTHFVEHIDKDNNGVITFEEWRDFLLLYPHTATIENIYQYWEKVYLVDIGEQAVIPEGISHQSNAVKLFIAGGFAGALSRTATAPFDRLKVVLMVRKGKQSMAASAYHIYKDVGFRGFFRGNGLNTIKVTPESAVKFYSFEMVKDLLVRFNITANKDEIGGAGKLFAGGVAGAIAQTAIYPMEVVKTRLMTHDGHAPALLKLSRDIWHQEGIRAFYRGLVPSVLGIIPYAGIDLATYETLKNQSQRWVSKDSETGVLIHLCCGMVSGAVAATCAYPLQVVRIRLQAQRMTATNRYKGMIDVFQRTWREEGLRAFYKGLFPTLLKVVPSASISYGVYEDMKRRLSV